MNKETDHYPGDPSDKYLEEKLKLNQVIINMKKIEEAIPILYKLFKEQSKQGDTMLNHGLQMKQLVSFHEFDAKLGAHRMDIDGNTVERLKKFQNSINKIVQSKVNEDEFKKAVNGKVNTNEHYHLIKKVKAIEADRIPELTKMVTAKIQEVDMLAHTKASQAELEVIKNNKVGKEELQLLRDNISKITDKILVLEGESKESEDEGEGNLEGASSEKDQRYIKNVYDYANEFYQQMKKDKKKGKVIGFKEHLKYHQLQVNEI